MSSNLKHWRSSFCTSYRVVTNSERIHAPLHRSLSSIYPWCAFHLRLRVTSGSNVPICEGLLCVEQRGCVVIGDEVNHCVRIVPGLVLLCVHHGNRNAGTTLRPLPQAYACLPCPFTHQHTHMHIHVRARQERRSLKHS